MTRTAKILLSSAIASLSLFWYFSPYWALYDIKSALKDLNAEGFNAHVDYPKLRENIKGQFTAAYASELGGFGPASAEALVNPIVDVLVRPETLMTAMSVAKASQEGEGPNPPGKTLAKNSSSKGIDEPPDWTLTRQGRNKVRVDVSVGAGKAEAKDKVGLVFERYGFSTWKLTEMYTPAFEGRQ